MDIACERCGAPGQVRNYPGPMPASGAWCDACYRRLSWTWPLRDPAIWIALAFALVLWGAIAYGTLHAIRPA